MTLINCHESIATQKITTLLREWIAQLEDLEAKGEATLDSCKMLIDLQQLLDKLDAMSLKRAGKTVQ